MTARPNPGLPCGPRTKWVDDPDPDTVVGVASGTETPPRESFRSVLTWPVVAAATVLATMAAGAVLWFAASSDDSDDRADSETVRLTDPVEVGNPLDVELTLPDQGSTTSLRELLDGRPVVVNLFGSWCTPCIKEMPDLQTVYTELGGAVDFIGVASQDRPEDTADIVEQTGVTYPWFSDRLGDMLTAVGGNTMPTTVFMDEEGTIVRMRAGAMDIDTMRDLVTQSFPGLN